jgi:uncharacterized membrane protein
MLKPQYFYLLVSLVFGTLFIILTPAFQVPDEVNHFYRSYHIAEGNFATVKADNRLGGYMPKSMIKAIQLHLDIKGSPYKKTSFRNIKEQLDQPIEDLTPDFIDFPNTALYTPLSYAPQALVIAIMKALGVRSPFLLLYGGRFFMLLLWITTVFYTIKNIPIFKWVFAVIALLPMSVFINMSISADVVTNILGFLWLGHVFKLAYNESRMTTKDIILLFVTAILLASSKYVYAPAVFLVFLIPFSKYDSWSHRKYWLLNTSLVLIALIVAFLGSSYASSLYISNAAYNPAHVAGLDIPIGADINGQMTYLSKNPEKIITVVFKAFIATFPMLKNTYIGVLGWLDVRIPMLFIYFGYVAILLVILYENAFNKFRLTYQHRLILLGVGISLMFLVYLSQYLSWAGVATEYCGSIQGRYFITTLPLIFLGFIFIALKHRFLLPLSLIMCIVVLASATQSLYYRYFSYSKKHLEISCDLDTTWKDEYIGEIYYKTNVPEVMLFAGATQSNEKFRSGSYSSKVTKQNPYGATLRLYNLDEGDTLKTEVWYFGEGGSLWITCAKHNLFNAQNNVTETDANGWKKISSSQLIDKKIADAEIGIFVESQNLCYFDDLKALICPKNK